MEADALSRLPLLENQKGIEIMLNHLQLGPAHLILNSYPPDLKLVNKYQQFDQALMKAVKEDAKFKFISLYENQLVIYQILMSNKQCSVIPK